jgi:hypothetical protein
MSLRLNTTLRGGAFMLNVLTVSVYGVPLNHANNAEDFRFLDF